jgi:hypothetical protein
MDKPLDPRTPDGCLLPINVLGFDLIIENPAGSIRSGTNSDGTTWSNQMAHSYGYFAGTNGADGDCIDCFVGPNLDADMSYVVNQNDPSTGAFDEHKVMLGFASQDDAEQGYNACFSEGWPGLGSVVPMTHPGLKLWLGENNSEGPAIVDPYDPKSDPHNDPAQPFFDPLALASYEAALKHQATDKAKTDFGGNAAGVVNEDPTAPPNISDDPTAVTGENDPTAPAKETDEKESDEEQSDDELGDSLHAFSDDLLLMSDGLEYTILADRGTKTETVGSDAISKDGILKLRQLMTICDSVNLNHRIYPKKVVHDAVIRANGARERARAGAMISEWQHPDVAQVKGQDHYIDNPDRKTARVDDIEPPDKDGKVYMTRTILNTPHGRMVAAAYRSKKPYGTSTRFKMKGHHAMHDGKKVAVADYMDIHNSDDVDEPAVPQTSSDYALLTDSQLSDIHTVAPPVTPPMKATSETATLVSSKLTPVSASADAAQSNTTEKSDDVTVTSAPLEARDSASITPHKERKNRMSPKTKKALSAYNVKIAQRANKDELLKARKAVTDCMEDEKDEEGMDTDAVLASLQKSDAMMTSMGGYNSGQTAPTMTDPRNIAGPYGNEFAPDEKPEANSGGTDPLHPAVNMQPKDSGLLNNDGTLKSDLVLKALGIDQASIDAIKTQVSEKAASDAKALTTAAINAACEDALATGDLKNLPSEQADFILSNVRAAATDAAQVPSLISAQVDNFSALLATNTLIARGAVQATGQTTADVARPGGPAVVVTEAKPWMAAVDRICAAADDHRRMTSSFNPNDTAVSRLRAYNRKNFIDPLIEQIARDKHEHKTAESWMTASDSLLGGNEQAMVDMIDKAAATSDTITTTTLFNQPSILTAFLVQQFQDMEFLQWVHAIGPGMDLGNGGFSVNPNSGNGQVGSVLRIPVELYTSPGGYGTYAGPQYDAGLQTPEGVGIDEASITTTFQAFAPSWRRIAVSLTRDVIKSMGNGPLNYPALARALYHIGYDKGRRIDKALADEMLRIPDEFQAVALGVEVVNATNNSVFGNTVNLNPAKKANAAVVTGDQSVTYGSGVIGAVRLTGQGAAGSTGGAGTAAPYFGSTYGPTPIVRPRNKKDLSPAGLLVSTQINSVTVTVPAGAVEGYIDANGNVATYPNGPVAGATATYAIDYNNSVIVFASGVTNASGVLTQAVAVQYSYATNFDNFVVNNPTLPTGVTYERYLNGLLGQFDTTAALMGSAPRYVKPNLALMSLNASVNITRAEIFFKLNSPDGTNLFPTENFFMERTGIMGARVNTPWSAQDSRILMTRNGATKYAIDTAFEIRGPYPGYQTNLTTGAQNIISKEIYYGEENSVICTPQVTDANGNILNPSSRTIILR